MKILVIGGTKFFGIHMVHELLDYYIQAVAETELTV